MYKRILLPLDGSAMAEQALPYAVAQAERFGAELILLRVLEPIAPTDAIAPKATMKQVEELTKTWALDYLERIAAGVQEQGISARGALLRDIPTWKSCSSPKQTRWI